MSVLMPRPVNIAGEAFAATGAAAAGPAARKRTRVAGTPQAPGERAAEWIALLSRSTTDANPRFAYAGRTVAGRRHTSRVFCGGCMVAAHGVEISRSPAIRVLAPCRPFVRIVKV